MRTLPIVIALFLLIGQFSPTLYATSPIELIPAVILHHDMQSNLAPIAIVVAGRATYVSIGVTSEGKSLFVGCEHNPTITCIEADGNGKVVVDPGNHGVGRIKLSICINGPTLNSSYEDDEGHTVHEYYLEYLD